ncbi:serine hydrolase [Streptomyces rubellomurinus]|uniref:Peptidase S11 D-alanyl-D-alanine carboxypeptidase A N-terminal domain-containing protein n=1 Tax=Streptomyces rubellomurinus (strain ATCC 31215) TaxID=359131 RepID=A0A0F2TH50_STRR3|nr:serine hydrolase [Streptomyces rubellomurinus]KJS61580.1 hypothetical protein VM95_14115 [Streptomyces rubellomurinus]
MGESPDRVLRDGEREREGERDGAGAAAVDTPAKAPDPKASEAADPKPSGAKAADAKAAGAKAADSAEPSAGGTGGGSTVQLRVQDADERTAMLRLPVDNRTTSLRLPVDNRTTALRLPAELLKPADEETSADDASDVSEASETSEASGSAPRAAGEEPGKAAEKPSGADPRLAIRTSAPVAEPEAEEDAEDADGGEPDTEDAPAEPVAPVVLTKTGQPGQRTGGAGKLEKPEPLRPAAVPAALPSAAGAVPAGTVPEPPEPGPLPEPEPAPKPLPKPAPEPAPKPGPAPTPLPEPDPRPVPPVPPLPAPEPLPSPENTAEAMEVLATLNSRPVSPLRRALKRITIWTVFLAVVLGAVVVAQLLRPLPDAKVRMTAAGSYSFAGNPLDLAWPAKGQSAAEVVGVGSLGSSGQETPASIASVTKVMNAYLILQKWPLKKGDAGQKFTVDKQAAQESGNSDESRVTLTEGQVLTEYQALELLMLPSANNVARLLARQHSGSEEAFVKLMNETAAKLGMTNTTYADPAGFNAETKSTAKDQLKLAEQVMQDEIFRQIVSTPETNFNNTKILNTNNLINPKTGVIGVKTGSSTPAGGCLMWAAYKDIGGVKRLILGVTLGQQATSSAPGDGILPTVLKVSGKQIQAAQNGLNGQTVVKKGDVVGTVDDGLGGKVPVVATKDLVVAGFPGISGTVTLDAGKLGHQEKAGKVVGSLRVGSGDDKVEVPVALQADLDPPSIQSRLLRTL